MLHLQRQRDLEPIRRWWSSILGVSGKAFPGGLTDSRRWSWMGALASHELGLGTCKSQQRVQVFPLPLLPSLPWLELLCSTAPSQTWWTESSETINPNKPLLARGASVRYSGKKKSKTNKKPLWWLLLFWSLPYSVLKHEMKHED